MPKGDTFGLDTFVFRSITLFCPENGANVVHIYSDRYCETGATALCEPNLIIISCYSAEIVITHMSLTTPIWTLGPIS